MARDNVFSCPFLFFFFFFFLLAGEPHTEGKDKQVLHNVQGEYKVQRGRPVNAAARASPPLAAAGQLMHVALVLPEVTRLSEPLLAQQALVRLLTCVRAFVFLAL